MIDVVNKAVTAVSSFLLTILLLIFITFASVMNIK